MQSYRDVLIPEKFFVIAALINDEAFSDRKFTVAHPKLASIITGSLEGIIACLGSSEERP